MRRVALVAVLALVVVTGAGAASRDLTPSRLTIVAADVAGARQTSQGPTHEKGYTAGYQRSFSFKAPNGQSGLVFVESEALVAPTIARAASDVAAVRSALSKPAGRAAFVASIAANLKVKPSQVKPGALRSVRVGDSSVELPVSVKLASRSAYESLSYLQRDRVVSVIVSAGLRPIAAGDTRRLGAAAVSHIDAALSPQSYAKPTVTGDAQVGSTLTAAPGSWSDPTAKSTYQWQRCDAAGATCAAIAGATQSTYVVVGDDVGFTLRVEVTATNRFGSTKADSAVTAQVPAPAPGPLQGR